MSRGEIGNKYPRTSDVPEFKKLYDVENVLV